jgi:DNA replication protein DnaC
MTAETTTTDIPAIRKRLHALGLFGLCAQDHDFLSQPWITTLLDIEQRERHRRSLERRLRDARLGTFKPLADFDWDWPQHIDRALFNELLNGHFLRDATNIVLVGPNGVGKSMLAKNLIHQLVLDGVSARFTTAADMLHDLAAQDSPSALDRRIKRYTLPAILCVDEIGYLAYNNRYADLLFEIVSRQYLQRPIILTTNLPFNQWTDIFPSATCVVTLIDRLVHRSEILLIDAQSYRLKEANERAEQRNARRKRKPTTSKKSEEPAE